MESDENTKGAILISYLTCIRILGGVMEILLLQPGFFLLSLRDVDALDLKDDRPRTVIATGDHHPVIVGPPLHDGPTLERGVHVPADGIPGLPAEAAVHQVVEVILPGRPLEQESVPFLEEGARTGMGIGQVFLLVIREALGLQDGYLALVFHLKMRFGIQRYAFNEGFPATYRTFPLTSPQSRRYHWRFHSVFSGLWLAQNDYLPWQVRNEKKRKAADRNVENE